MTLTLFAQNGDHPSEPFVFAGFHTPNSTAVPDDVFDVLMPHLSDIELRVLLYIIRRTFGFKKSADDISLKQMVDGITTKDGRVLDGGCGLSRPSVTKAVRGLVAKNIVLATANYSESRGFQATTYTLVFRGDPSQRGDEGDRNGVTMGDRKRVTIQDPVKQHTGRQEDNSNSTSCGKNVDNDVENIRRTPYLDQVITDFGKEFGDALHTNSNCKQARNVLCELGITEDDFIERFVYPARAKTRHATGIEKRMPYFFSVLRDVISSQEEATAP